MKHQSVVRGAALLLLWGIALSSVAAPGAKPLYQGLLKSSPIAGVTGFKVLQDDKTGKKTIVFSPSCAFELEKIGSREGHVDVLSFQGKKGKCALGLPERVSGRVHVNDGREVAGVIQFHGPEGSKTQAIDIDVASAWRVEQ